MTKKEMLYNIISNISNFSEAERMYCETYIDRIPKRFVEEIYNLYKNDKEHAPYYYQIIWNG